MIISTEAHVISAQFNDTFINRVYSEPIGVGSTPEAAEAVIQFLLDDGYQDEQFFECFVVKKFRVNTADQLDQNIRYYDREGKRMKEPPSDGNQIVIATR